VADSTIRAQNDTPQIMLFSNGDTNTFALTIEPRGRWPQRHAAEAPTTAA